MFTRILLLEEGFTTCHIIRSVKYFMSDVEKISNRCKDFCPLSLWDRHSLLSFLKMFSFVPKFGASCI